MSNCNRDFKRVKTINVSVFGTELLLTIPQGNYFDNQEVQICVIQPINCPSSNTSNLTVSVQLGDAGDIYPLQVCGHKVYADQIKARHCYYTRVATDTSTFNYIGGACLCCTNHVSPPVLTTAPQQEEN